MSTQDTIQKVWTTAQIFLQQHDLDLKKVGLGVLVALAGGAVFHVIRAVKRASKRSIVLIGKSRKEEDELSKLLGVDVEKFLNASNMIALSAVAPECKIDGHALLRTLQDKYPDFVVTKLIAMNTQFKEGNKSQALATLAQIRASTPSSHPLYSLIPSDQDLDENALPQMKLEEVVPNLVWRCTQYKTNVDAHGFIFRKSIGSNELVLVNAVHISPEVAEQIRALGNVTHIVNNTKMHYMELVYCKQLFPQAQVIGVASHKTHGPSSSIPFDGFLNETKPIFPSDQFVEIQMNGHAMGETWLFHVPSKSLVIGDFFLSCSHGRSYPNLYMAQVGVLPLPNYETACANYAPLMVENIVSLKASVKKALNTEFDRILIIHGPTFENKPKEVLKNVVGWIPELGIMEQLCCVVRVFLERPSWGSAFWNLLTAKK